MASPSSSSSSLLLLLSFFAIVSSSSSTTHHQFVDCLTLHHTATPISAVTYTPTHPSFQSILTAYIQNLRFISPLPTPLAIITPTHHSHIYPAILCSTKHNIELRIRSGGHDFEGSSYISDKPFIIVDLFNLRSIAIDVDSSTAWVQSGATLGELYYEISQTSKTLGFPGGNWATVGVGGQLSGGGYGCLVRKYGLASDNVIDARIMDVNGKIMDRTSMSEDLFWAIRGGGGGNFGIVLEWKIKLVEVPDVVTFCGLVRTSEQGLTKLVHKWQFVAPAMPKDLLIEIHLQSLISPATNVGRTMRGRFTAIYLGKLHELLPLMADRFPELDITSEDCKEISWVEAAVHSAAYPDGVPPEILPNRTAAPRGYAKQKGDYVQEPIPQGGLEGLWEIFHKMDPGSGDMVWTAYGGRMGEIPESETPYPHRGDNIFKIYEGVYWDGEKEGAKSERHIKWMNEMHDYLGKYVSKSPRGAYISYRDLDLGVNNVNGETSYDEARVWGVKYYKNNFKRLALVKAMVDPNNFFRNEQSIPPFTQDINGGHYEL